MSILIIINLLIFAISSTILYLFGRICSERFVLKGFLASCVLCWFLIVVGSHNGGGGLFLPSVLGILFCIVDGLNGKGSSENVGIVALLVIQIGVAASCFIAGAYRNINGKPHS